MSSRLSFEPEPLCTLAPATLYQYIRETSFKMLPLDRVWRRHFPELVQAFNWSSVWANINLILKYWNHLTSRKLFLIKVTGDASCSLCSLKTPGTFLHTILKRPPVAQFWHSTGSELTEFASSFISAQERYLQFSLQYFTVLYNSKMCSACWPNSSRKWFQASTHFFL